ncbi:helix-turn-helix domain-containing protein [Enhygromyxa salina]|uniref:DNA-binding transcriptional repressor PuuR n=1 Tax=Enhygromyxa salina TaxID=215803 RepID=A0A2S9Y097_9BACT|nr:helix-turn-helix transcriptional regulator [Enhygromyxa salina]PRP98523.1 DNA-binding transcriptional repressor PuuR [Enhygromyxa salina]
MSVKSFGRHIRSCRRARGLTQEALADLSGLSPDTIRRLEHGSFSPSLDTLRKLCMGFDMLLSTLFESFELGERDGPRELVDALAFITPEEEQALLQFIAVFRQRFQDDEN